MSSPWASAVAAVGSTVQRWLEGPWVPGSCTPGWPRAAGQTGSTAGTASRSQGRTENGWALDSKKVAITHRVLQHRNWFI